MRYIFIFSVIVAVYYLAGLLGLQFTLDGSNSSVLWPPAGMALAALICKGWRYAPAVFVGAYVTNYTHFGTQDLNGFLSVFPSALGAALQALLGYYLIQRFVSLPTTLRNVKDPFLIVLLGGGVACLFNALFANAAFTNFIIHDYALYLKHSFAWWVGDVLGVILFTPIMILICSKSSKNYQRDVGLGRKVIVATVMLFLLGVVTYLFHVMKEYEYNERQGEFIRHTYEISESLKNQLNVVEKALEINERYFSTQDMISAKDFRAFNEGLVNGDNGLYGLSWIPKVLLEEREEFEFALRAQGYKDFAIKHRFEKGVMLRAEDADIYFPIAYTAPYARNERAHGFDVYGVDPLMGYGRRKLLDAARDSGNVVATKMFPIVQAESQYGFIMYYPVYRDNYRRNLDNTTIDERRERLIGFINGIFVFPHFMEHIKRRANIYSMDIVLYEVDSEGGGDRLLYDSRTVNNREPAQDIVLDEGQYIESEIFYVAGQVWRLDMVSRIDYAMQKGWIIWAVMISGLLFTGLISLFMILLTARTEIVQILVDKKTEELNNARQFQELIMYHNPDLMFVKNEHLEIVEANQAFLSAYPDYQRDHVVGRSGKEGYSKDDYDAFTEQDRKAFADGHTETVETIIFPDGKKRTLFTQKIRFEDAKGDAFLLGISRDVTEREELISQLTETNAELEEFAYRTSHDLRAPLVSSAKLLSMADKALDKGQIDTVRQCMQHAQTSIHKLEALVQDILQLTQAKSGNEEIEDVNINLVITNALDKISHIDGYERINFMREVDVNKTVRLCKNRFVLIVENLLSNAVKYTDPNEPKPEVRIKAYFSRKKLVLRVEDNGLGVPEENQNQLFTMFKRFHPKVSFGSGLGLYMMKKSADILGGEISFEPLKKGSAFILKVPVNSRSEV
ncbi:MAG: CHASE domain-containing protein [Alphaproteobacteria bacterium]